MLNTLEHYFRWYRNGANGSPACLNKSIIFDFKNTSIEHIYPQNATGRHRPASKERLKHNLGNLTFLGKDDNQLVDNDSFANKKRVLSSSSVQMNTEIAGNTSWTVSTIKTRQQTIIDLAKKVFSV